MLVVYIILGDGVSNASKDLSDLLLKIDSSV